MAEDKKITPPAGTPGSGSRVIYILAAALAAIAGFATVAIIASRDTRNGVIVEAETAPAERSEGEKGLARLVKVIPPAPLEGVAFQDADGKPRTLADWKGKVVLLNLWATWCAPCKAEMPSLARLQSKLGGADFEVVAVSQDRAGADAPRKFLASAGISQLGLYLDTGGKLVPALKAPGLPLSVLIDREGRQIARLAGPAEWDSPQAEAVIRAAISAKGG